MTNHPESFRTGRNVFPSLNPRSAPRVTPSALISLPPSPRCFRKKLWGKFDLIADFGILRMMRTPNGSLPIEDFHGEKIKKISRKQWINHYKGTWNNLFFMEE